METATELISPTGDTGPVTPNYNKLSDHIRRLTPQGFQCSVFCGGTNCKYENPNHWTPDNLAIQGLYSHWITDKVLAMARPSTVVIIQKNIIQQFHSLGIKSVINLQCQKEHASCGQPLENSGFSYDPNIFMENGMFYYNFEWKDYGDVSLISLLNMVKVLAFACNEGRVAIHCHAGLGRTGVLIACYLIFSLRVHANQAIKYVRLRRPGSVQTRVQIQCIRHFAQYILPNLVTFYIKESGKDRFMTECSLSRFLKRQKIALHGYEERYYKYLPKIIHKICERILKICGCWAEDYTPNSIPYTTDFLCSKEVANVSRQESIYSICSHNFEDVVFLSPSSINSSASSTSDLLSACSTPSSPNRSENEDMGDIIENLSETEEESQKEYLLENQCFQELEKQKHFEQKELLQESIEIQDVRKVVDAIIMSNFNELDQSRKKAVRQLQNEINTSQLGWYKLDVLNDATILAALMFEWLENLKIPVFDLDNLEVIVLNSKSTEVCLSKLKENSAFLVEYLMLFVSKLQINEDMLNDVLKRLMAALTHQYVIINDNVVPSSRGYRKLREGTTACTMNFLKTLMTMVSIHHRDRYIPRDDD